MSRLLLTLAIMIVGGICECAYAQTAESFCRSFSSDKYANCMTTRDYVAKARIVVAKKIDAACFPDQPDGFNVRYLLNDDKKMINDAVAASVAEMAKQLFGKKQTKEPICNW